MVVVLELLAGIVITSAVVVTLAVLGAAELGRAISRDDEQREPPVIDVTPSRCRRAA
jgi:hypothetical protein